MFAAKHLQPGYVQSFPMPDAFPVDRLVDKLESDPTLAQTIYDTKQLPEALMKEVMESDE